MKQGAMGRRAPVIGSLCMDVLSEAQRSAGTWSLATYTRIADSLAGANERDIEYFISEIIKRILSPESLDGERYKLSQLCTMAKQKQYSGLNQILIRYKNDMLEKAGQITDSPLGVAASHLLHSLYEDGEPRPQRKSSLVLRVKPATDSKDWNSRAVLFSKG
jgi:hypothetical protein